MTTKTRSQPTVYLLGSKVTELCGIKLPTQRMVLGFFLHRHLDLKETIRQSSAVTANEVGKFWQKARIPLRHQKNCQTKIEQLFEKWRLIKKNKGRQSTSQKEREEAFVYKLDDLFDIALANALTMMTADEDKDFLLAQREKGRRGS